MFSLAINNVTRTLFYKLYKKLPNFFNQIKFLNAGTSGNEIRDILFAPVQLEKDKKPKKVSIIGAAGNVGSIIGYELILKKICDEVVLYDTPEQKGKLCGIAIDLLDGTSFANHPKIKVCINGKNTKDSDLLIICAGGGPKIGQKRLDILKQNADIFKKIIPMLVNFSPNCIILVVSNPVDIMAYAAWKFSGFPINRVLGSGTTLDSSRLKMFIGKKLGISPKSINAWMIGEHGGSCVTCWSTINVAGTRLKECKASFGLKDDPECWFKLEKLTIKQGYVVQKLRGFTNYAISMSVSEISEAILLDKRTVHAVSTYCNGIYGVKVESFLSLPAVIGNKGVHQIVKLKLDSNELKKFKKSASILDKALKSYKWGGEQKKGEQKKEKLRQCN